jgi:hypothetical protein
MFPQRWVGKKQPARADPGGRFYPLASPWQTEIQVPTNSKTKAYRLQKHSILEEAGAPEGIRTPGLCLRRAALYPAELRVRRRMPIAVRARLG